MTDLTTRIQDGLQLEREGRDDDAIAHFQALAAEYPDHAQVIFEYAGSFDSAGREAEAIPLYRQAMQMGLDEDYMARAYLQLGSSLRNVNAHAEAVQVLSEGCQRYPDQAALRLFLAFAQESAGQTQAAITNLLNLAQEFIRTEDMIRYARALRFYTDDRLK
jgi:cyanophycin synthetase